MCHSALLYRVKGRRNFVSLTKVAVCRSFLTIMLSDLPRVLVWGYSFVKRLRADLERPGFQVDLQFRGLRSSLLIFNWASIRVDIILRASLRVRYIIRSHQQPFLATEFKDFTVKIP